ncbi:MAG: type II toxin-antitoxin system HicA family toxin [Candidatus Paceibacteria bacterium]
MPKLPRIPSSLVLQALRRDGFYVYNQTGGHIQLRHSVKQHLRITIPYSKKDLAPKTLKTIIKQAELTVEEFIKLL